MDEELPKLIAEAQASAVDARNTFGHLAGEQLNWRPNPNQWSVAQCFEHLITINSEYFPIIEKIVTSGYTPSWKERLPLLPRLFGSLVLKAVEPDTPRKLKAAPRFEPSSSAIGGDIVSMFLAHQTKVVECMRKTEHVDLRNTIITSPVASFVTYSLLDAFRIVVAHERRHMKQAVRVMESPNFPNQPASR